MPNNLSDLEWQSQMGVDETIENKPQNRFEKKKKKEKAAAKPAKISQVKNVQLGQKNKVKPNIASPSSTATQTRSVADACNTLEELRKAVHDFKDLSIVKTATNTVFSDGNPESDIMFIGEAPGAEEDAKGIPFCGASGQLLDKMLACIDLSRAKNFYISNTVFWRPPGNRRPTPEELATCLPFVEKHISIIKPKLIILVGGTAVTSLLGSKEGITKMRGNFYDYSNQYLSDAIKTTAIFHPSYLLRSPGQKRVAWKDLLKLKEYMDTNA